MGPNFTPLSIHQPPGPSINQPPRPKKTISGKVFGLIAAFVLVLGMGAGFVAMQSGLFYRSNASTGFNPIDRRPYESCYQPFMTQLNGAQITINTGANCATLPPISIDVWRMNSANFDDQTLVWHREFTVSPGSNTLTIPSNVFDCNSFYQIDTWFGTGTPPANANYAYALITATFVKPANSISCGAIPAQYCNSGATIQGPASCSTPPTKTPTPPPQITPPTKTPTPIATKTPTKTPTVTPKPSTTLPPTPTNACPKPNPVKNLRINCPICKQS